jgi:hypothetical protein
VPIDPRVRSLELADLDWVVALNGRRRQLLADFAPRFWRPAPDASTRQRDYLRDQIRDPVVVSLRTDWGLVFAGRRGSWLEVDDLALEDDGCWPRDGAVLLRAVNTTGDLRFVCPVPEPARRRTAVDLGWELAEVWWHRDLPERPASPPAEVVVAVPGACGRLIDPPPVYLPGGPVLLAEEVRDGSALATIEEIAASRGAVVSVVSRTPDQPTDFLRAGGHRPTTEFFVSPRLDAGRLT